jgi:hypothetical protein
MDYIFADEQPVTYITYQNSTHLDLLADLGQRSHLISMAYSEWIVIYTKAIFFFLATVL